MELPTDFDFKYYKLLNNDLKDLNEQELKKHYLIYGINEGRLYKNKLPIDFNVYVYKKLNNDLKDLNNDELSMHYLMYGKNEKRLYKIILPIDFNQDIYKKNYDDLINLSNEDLKYHYFFYGFIEKRLYNIPYDFNYITYKNLNNDLKNLNKKELIEHYITYGIKENRNYISNNNYNKINFIDRILWINLIKSCDRKDKMKNILNNINIENIKVNAIDGINLEYYKLINLENENKNLSIYEIACTLSHIKAIYRLKYIDGNFFMICEDDISFNNLIYFKKNLKDIIMESPEFDILILNKTCNQELNDLYTKWNDYNINFCSTASYIISRNGINKICDIVNYNIDTFIFNKKINVADIFIYKYVNTYVYKYNFINIDIYTSTINNCDINNYILIYNSINNLNLIKKDKDLI